MRSPKFRVVLALALLVGTVIVSIQPGAFVAVTALTLGVAVTMGVLDLRERAK